MRKATGSYPTYPSLVKLQPKFLSLQWKTCLWAEFAALVPEFAVKDLPLGRTHDDDDDDDEILTHVHKGDVTISYIKR